MNTAHQLACAVLGQQMGVRTEEYKAYIARIDSLASVSHGRSYIDQEQLLSVCMDEWQKMDIRAQEVGCAVATRVRWYADVPGADLVRLWVRCSRPAMLIMTV